MSDIGYATLSIIPSALDFGKKLAEQVVPEAEIAGRSAGLALSKGAAEGGAGFLDFGKKSAIALLAVGAGSAKLAVDFQDSTTKLVTGAGESEEAIGKVKQGLLDMAPAVGIGPDALAKGMFLVESAGFHGADGLKVMAAAAEGAKIGGAQTADVANALTTVMKDYDLGAGKAADTTSKLVATVASGKTNMTDLSGALSAVVPAAAAAHINLNDLLGSIGTMTGEGISAQQSAQDLASTIASLSNPTAEQSKAMAQMGLNSMDVASHLGENGLSGTMGTLYQAVMQHMGPAGTVLESAFNQSKLAAASAKTELENLPPSLQKLGQGYLDGTVTQKEWAKELKTQPALVQGLAKQFATTAKEANGFSDTLKSGKGDAKTFNAAMADMLGGSTGLATSLALTGTHSKDLTANIKSIGSASTETGGHVKGWEETQKDLGTQLSQAGAGIEAMGVKIGTKLIPPISEALKTGESWISSLMKNTPLFYTVAGIIGTVLVVAITAYIGKLVWGAVESAINFAKMVGEVVAWAAKTAASIVGTLGRWVWYAGQWLANTAITLAQWTAKNAVAFAEWAANTARQTASSIATWVRYNAMVAAENAKGLAAMLAGNVKALATWVAETVASGAKAVAVWVANSAKTVAAIAIQSAAFIAQKAVLIGGAVAMGVATAAQWALNVALDANPIALIIIAIVALVAALVWFFTQTKLGQDIWKNLCDFFQTAFQAVVDFLTAAWNGIVAFFQWAIGLIVEVVKIEFALIQTFIVQPIQAAIAWLTGAWNNTVSFFQTVIGNIGRAVSDGFNNVLSFVESIGGKIGAAIGDAGKWLFNSGKAIIQGLIDGISSMIHAATSAVGNVMGAIANFFPHSPAKEGPFSGKGWTLYSGAAMADGLAEGMNSRLTVVRNSAVNLMGAASDALVPTLPTVSAPTPAEGGFAGAVASAFQGGDSTTLNYTQVGGQGFTAEQELQRAARMLKQRRR